MCKRQLAIPLPNWHSSRAGIPYSSIRPVSYRFVRMPLFAMTVFLLEFSKPYLYTESACG